MDVVRLKKNIVVPHFVRYELAILNWIFSISIVFHQLLESYLVSFDGNCSQTPRRDVHPVVFNIWPFVLIVN